MEMLFLFGSLTHCIWLYTISTMFSPVFLGLDSNGADLVAFTSQMGEATKNLNHLYCITPLFKTSCLYAFVKAFKMVIM